MKSIFSLSILLVKIGIVAAQPIFKGDTTPTYHRAISVYNDLDERFVNATLYQKGLTDSGEPLHLFVINHPDFPGLQAHETARFNKRVLLISNAIHPGEACGVNASIMLARYLLEDASAEKLLQNTVVCIIPIYNIGGALQRNSSSRANQNGPVEYGFRGNARNLDLNRDFTKMDSRNAQSFARLFHELDPHVYLETHTSNGADYQYTMTLLPSQKDKLDGEVSALMTDSILPGLYQRMEVRNSKMIPYVNVYGRAPENGGIQGFLDSPRYSSGFAAQFQCMSFMSEAHMLKPFEDRVNATFDLMLSILEEMENHGPAIARARFEARDAIVWQEAFPLNWEMDSIASDTLEFKGYVSTYKKSEVTGLDRLYYDRSSPVTMQIPHYDHYVPKNGVLKPRYYAIPQSWHEVIERLRLNGVEMNYLTEDVQVNAEVQFIDDYDTRRQPYEGHYLHYDTRVRSGKEIVFLYKGDVIVPMYTTKDRFVVEVLEPVSVDSYFNWNYFDEILQQKEWFSSYVFEDEAEQMLKNDSLLRSSFEQEKRGHSEFAKNSFAQLYWLYQQSEHYEQQHMRYPVLRILEEQGMPMRPVRH